MVAEAKDIFEAHSQSLRMLMSENGLGLYLPPYQRPYGWSKDKVAKLVDDTLHGLSNLGNRTDSFTFLGTVITIHDIEHATVQPAVKQQVPAKVLTVIDGQQRLSSLLLLIVCLHNQIRQARWRVFKGKVPDQETEAIKSALHSETQAVLRQLSSAFYENHHDGDSPLYPRLIRAFDDQWSRNAKEAIYHSPIAHFLAEYSKAADAEERANQKPGDYNPAPRIGMGDGEADLVKRYRELRAWLSRLAKGQVMEEFESVPPLGVLAGSSEFQRALFNHPLDDGFCDWLKELEEGNEAQLVRVVMLGAYVLNRIALTVVRGRDEDYAFTVFESLNTTGEPLTAFETFLPRVVNAEGLPNYQKSEAHGHMEAVKDHLSRFQVGDRLQAATRDLLVSFALAETGDKLSKRLADQRAYMKDEFEAYKDDVDDRTAFLEHLHDTATFIGRTWDSGDSPRQLVGLDASAMTDTVRLCLGFLDSLKHTVAIAPLVRFYSAALHASPEDRQAKVKEFEDAIKAITAFTVLWRSTRTTTGNIDSEYREVMSGSNSPTTLPALARSNNGTESPTPDAAALKNELAARLQKNGEIPNQATYVARARNVPLYRVNNPLTRFVLLAAYHDSVEDPSSPGLIHEGKLGSAPCLTADGWADQNHTTVEHVAPRDGSKDWQPAFYAEKDIVHRIGNLVLAPTEANSSLNNRPWAQKKVLYTALGAKSKEEAREVLTAAATAGMTFTQTTEELAQLSRYMPHLHSLGERAGDWDLVFADLRAERLLELAYVRLAPWLGIDPHAAEEEGVVAATHLTDVDDEGFDDELATEALA